MAKREKPTRRQILDSAEHFYGQKLTPDREFIVTTSAACIQDHYVDPKTYRKDFTSKVYCSLAHEGKPFGSLFWCPCQCHTIKA
jgi:hypothetical protein